MTVAVRFAASIPSLAAAIVLSSIVQTEFILFDILESYYLLMIKL
ncbi:MAG TPA: hypothetical protein VF599_14750 [Pyrinomonadaceae bacterium]